MKQETKSSEKSFRTEPDQPSLTQNTPIRWLSRVADKVDAEILTPEVLQATSVNQERKVVGEAPGARISDIRSSALITTASPKAHHKRPRQSNVVEQNGGQEPLLRTSRRVKFRHTLDPTTFPSETFTDNTGPLSPLFFSHTHVHRPAPPLSFSSSDAAATRLSESLEEYAGFTTLNITRGNMSSYYSVQFLKINCEVDSLGRREQVSLTQCPLWKRVYIRCEKC